MKQKVITAMVNMPADDRAYIVFYLGSLIWGIGESCTIVHGIT